MIRILASEFNNYEKLDGKKITRPMDNANGVVDQIKNSLINNKKIVFVTSDMNKPRESVIGYANITFDSMKMVGISFDEYLILDRESMKNANKYIDGASLVFLCGGDTYKQHELFEAINLRELLSNYDGLVIGQSAGALNMASNVLIVLKNKKTLSLFFLRDWGLLILILNLILFMILQSLMLMKYIREMLF